MASLALTFLVTPSAIAAPTEAILDAAPPLNITVVYGDYWTLLFNSNVWLCGYETYSVQVTGIESATESFNAFPYGGAAGTCTFYLEPGGNNLIDVGSYSVKVALGVSTFGNEQIRAVTGTPQSLVIKPAELVVDVRVTPDSADPQNTVVSMRLGGTWLDYIGGENYRTEEGRQNLARIPAPPQGEWQMTIRDAAGTTVVDQKLDQARGETPAMTYLWTQAPIAENYTVEATFTPTGDESPNFTVAQANPVSFTTGEASRPQIDNPVEPELPPSSAPEGFALPLGALVVAGLLGLGAAIAALVVATRSRLLAPANGGYDADAAEAKGAKS